METDDTAEPPAGIDPAASSRVCFLMLALVAGAVLVYVVARPKPGPPPPEIAHDPLLVEGREIFLSRCASCHGPTGKGDGPVAKNLQGPPPGDLTDAEWKHGGRPEQVEAVIAKGVPGTNMAGWSSAYSASQIRAVTAYSLFLGGQPVPESLRKP